MNAARERIHLHCASLTEHRNIGLLPGATKPLKECPRSLFADAGAEKGLVPQLGVLSARPAQKAWRQISANEGDMETSAAAPKLPAAAPMKCARVRVLPQRSGEQRSESGRRERRGTGEATACARWQDWHGDGGLITAASIFSLVVLSALTSADAQVRGRTGQDLNWQNFEVENFETTVDIPPASSRSRRASRRRELASASTAPTGAPC